MDRLRQDLREALRSLSRTRATATIGVLALALGIGANTAVFSVANAFVFTPPPWRATEDLAVLMMERVSGDPIFPGVSFVEFEEWQATTRAFEGMAYITWSGTRDVATGNRAERVNGSLITHEMIDLLGMQPLVGRGFRASDDRPGAEPTILLSESLWQDLFDGDGTVVGRSVRLDGVAHTVIGVMPHGFSTGPARMWLPARQAMLVEDRLDRTRRARNLVMARLAPGASMAQADDEMQAIAARQEEQHPDANRDLRVNVVPLERWMTGEFAAPVHLLLGVVLFVLLIACANVANLLLARVPERRREMALRAAIGATRGRIARLLITESLLIGIAAGGLGLLLAAWGVYTLEALLPPGFTLGRITEIPIDGRVLLFTAGVSVLASLLFGFAPAVQSSRTDLYDLVKQAGPGGLHGNRSRLRDALVISEIALALVLLVGAGLLLRNFVRFQRLDVGFDPSHVLTGTVHLPEYSYGTLSQVEAFREDALVAVSRESEALAVAVEARLGSRTPFDRGFGFEIEGVMPDVTEADPPLAAFAVSPDYFTVKRIRLVRGRVFTALDRAGAAGVAVVNESLAERMWPDGDAIGRSLRLRDVGEGAPWLTVVGIIGDVRQPAHTEMTTVPFSIYVPIAQHPERTLTLYVRTRNEPAAFTPGLRRALASVDTDVPLSSVRTLEQMLETEAFDRAAMTALLNTFALLGLILAGLGVYGVIRHSVEHRTHEIAVRMGLGARAADVVRMIVAQGARLAAIGIAIGLFGAWGLTRVMASMLDTPRPADPIVIGAMVLMIALIALFTSWWPARRVTRIQPMDALRTD